MSKITRKVFGGGGSTGILGTGRFKPSTIDVDKQPFQKQLEKTGSQEGLRQRQVQQTERLEQTATGQKPSLAEAQLKAATDKNLAQQIAAARAARGGSVSARQRQLARSQAESGQQLAQQAGIQRLAEQQQAEQALAQQLAQQRQQDIALAESDRASQQALQQLLVNQNIGAQTLAQQGFQAAGAQRGQLAGGVMSGIGSLMASDEKAKKNIKKIGSPKSSMQKFSKGFSEGYKNSDKETTSGEGAKKLIKALSDKNAKKEQKSPEKDFLDKLNAVSYEYKNATQPGAKEGKIHGIIAQDLEKSELGKQMVLDTPNGKMVDFAQGFGAVLAAQANLNKRLQEIEKKKK